MPFFTEERRARGLPHRAPPGSRSTTSSACCRCSRPRSASRASPAVVAVPLGLGAAIYLSEYAPERVRRTVKPVLELLAGMPTIVLGFFALDSLTPALQNIGIVGSNQLFSALSAGIVVGVLITPLISSLSEDALRAVPERDARGRLRGRGDQARTSRRGSCFPAALSGVMAAIVLGLSRAVGETMAVTLAAGTQPNLTSDPTQPDADDHGLHRRRSRRARPPAAPRSTSRSSPSASCCSWSR